MQLSAATLSLTALAAAGVAFAQGTFTVNTPATLIQCQPIQISWSGGTAPYFPRITQGGQVGNTLNSFDQQTGTMLTWTVNQPAGTSVTIAIGDSAGLTAATSQVTVNPGGSGCLNGGGSGGGSGGNGGSSSSGGGSGSSSQAPSSSSGGGSSSSSSAAPSSSSSAASSPSSSAPSRPSSSASANAPTSTASSGGSGNGAESIRGFSAVVAGVVGVAAAALL